MMAKNTIVEFLCFQMGMYPITIKESCSRFQESIIIILLEKTTIVSYLGWNINLQICYDLRFPELCRNHIIVRKPAYDLLLYVANWPEKRIEHWTTLLKARAIENQAYVIGANRIGLDGKDLFYSGGSSICDPNGNTMELKIRI
jgi:Predicted amidohydrolase